MQKITKGALASGAAALLLIGGGSTLALWSDSEVITGGEITFGALELTPGVENATETSSIELVPGDDDTIVNTYTVTAEGDGLEATIAVTDPSVSGDDGLTSSTSTTFTPEGGEPGELPTTITEAQNGGVITVTTTVSLAEGEENDNALNAAEDITITPGTVTIAQVSEEAPEVP